MILPLIDLLLALELALSAFSSVQQSTAHVPASDSLVVLAAGDVMLANWLVPILEKEGPGYPFRHVEEELRGADLRIINLEAPFADSGRPFDKKFTFRVPTHLVRVLEAGGFDAANLANNHILDYGTSALRTTLSLLDSLGVLAFGAGMDVADACCPRYIERRGVRIGLLGFSLTFPEEFYATSRRPGTCFGAASRVRSAIQVARDSADVVIASFHWGSELREMPKRYQRDLAHLAIDSGADLVIGHHPHVLQGLEVYRGKLIAYSLGNFVFASYSDRARDSALLVCGFGRGGVLREARVVPLNVWNRQVAFQPRVLAGEEADRLFRYLNRISAPLNGGREILDERGYVVLKTEPSQAN